MAWLEGVGYCTEAELAALDEAVAEADIEDAQAGWNSAYAMLQDAGRARELDELRAGEDAIEDALGRRGSSEARLARAAQRIGRGSYVAGHAAALERDGLSVPGGVTGDHCCGPSDPLGYCMNSSHEQTCGALSTTETAQALAASGAYAERASRPVLDATGAAAVTAAGVPAQWSDVIEAFSGQRLHGAAAFEDGTARPELAQVYREGYGELADAGLLDRARAAMGISTPPTASQRGAGLLTRQALASMRGVRPGQGETAAERAARQHRDVTAGTLRQVDEPLHGSAGSYAAG